MKSLYLIFFVAILWNCDSEHSPKLTNIEVTYSEKFSVYGPNTDFRSSVVTLIFENGGFTGHPVWADTLGYARERIKNIRK
jgi:hypothetical protein